MTIKDLKKGEYYHADYDNLVFIYSGLNTFNEIRYSYKCQIYRGDNIYHINNSFGRGGKMEKTLKLATEEEKHWLNKCIEANKFISYEEAIKDFSKEFQFEVGKWYKSNNKEYLYTKFSGLSDNKFMGTEHIYGNPLEYANTGKFDTWMFKIEENPQILTNLSEIQQYLPEGHPDKISNSIPEYVECIKSIDSTKWVIGRIYKLEGKKLRTEKGYLPHDNFKLINFYQDYDFKPSTKKAYDAQFENEFTLPEKWCIKRTDESWEIITKYLNSLGGTYLFENKPYNWVTCWEEVNKSSQYKPKGYVEITFEQFKKYVLKSENTKSLVELLKPSQKKINEIFNQIKDPNKIIIPKAIKKTEKAKIEIKSSDFMKINVDITVKPRKIAKQIKIKEFQLTI